MKANEAPEKLYVDVCDNFSDSFLYGFTEKRKDDDIEYIRTDAFIKKACEWLKCQDEMVGISFTEDFIVRFKDYLKGE